MVCPVVGARQPCVVLPAVGEGQGIPDAPEQRDGGVFSQISHHELTGNPLLGRMNLLGVDG